MAGTYGPYRQQTYLDYPPTAAPISALVVVHGGGWVAGSDDNALDVWISGYLADLSIHCFNINYRLIGDVDWPGPLQDVQMAIRWARTQVKAGLKVGVLGTSAGGHLALMSGLQAKILVNGATDPSNEAGLLPTTSPVPSFVVSISGPTDIVAFYQEPSPPYVNTKPYVTKLIAGIDPGGLQAMKSISPTDLLTATMPPSNLIQGNADLTVAPGPINVFYGQLQALRSGIDGFQGYPGGHVLAGTTEADRELYMRIVANWILGLT